MFNTNKKIKKKIINFNDKELKHSEQIVVLGMIYNDKNNFKDHIIKGSNKEKSLFTRIKQKINLIKNIKYWTSNDELKIIANSYINGLIQYGIQLWSMEEVRIIDKIEKLRRKTVEIIYGNQDKDLA